MPEHVARSHTKGNNSQGSESSSNASQKQPVPARRGVHYAEELAQTPPKLASSGPSFAGTDDEDDDDDGSDWSDGDEHLADEGAGLGKQLRARHWTIWRLLTILYSSLIGSVFLAGILVTPALLVHFLWYKPHPTSYRHYVDQNIEAWLFWVSANVVISWGLAMVVDIIPTIARLLISIAWGHVSEAVKSQIELYDSVKDTFKPVLYAASAWISWIVLFQNIFQLYNGGGNGSSFAPYTDRLAQAIQFLFFSVLVISIQRMLSHAIAFAFHRTAYKERLEEVERGLRVIERLREYKPRTRQQPSRPSNGHGMLNLSFINPFSDKDPHHHHRSNEVSHGCNDGDDADAEDNGGKRIQRSAGSRPAIHPHEIVPDSSDVEDIKLPTSHSALNPSDKKEDLSCTYPPTRKHHMDKSARHQKDSNLAIQAVRVIKSAILHDARNIKGKDDDPNGLRFTVNSPQEAKRQARAIYKALRDHHRTYLVSRDFVPAFASPEEAQEAFHVFDRDNNGDIPRSEIKATILRIYKERRFLSRSMRDVGVALKTLNQILLVFALIILFFISLSVFGLNVTQSLTSMYSLGIAASFVFKNAASNMFDAIMFLFVTHPFDTGDRCFIDAENLIVKKMGLFATVFVRSDGTEAYYSNNQLLTKFITNVRRSDKMAGTLTMQVAWRTPLDKLDALEDCLNEWLAMEENRWFQPSTSISLQNISFQRHLIITISIPHNSAWQDWGAQNARKTAFHAAVQYYCRQLGISACGSPIPIAYLDSDTQQTTPVIPEIEYHNAEHPARSLRSEGSTKNVLGFVLPQESGSMQLQARKSKSRKAVLRGNGADAGITGH